MKKSFNIQELLDGKSKRHETKPRQPSSSRAFQRDQECELKHPGSMDLISTNKTKRNNTLPCFIDRFQMRRDKIEVFGSIEVPNFHLTHETPNGNFKVGFEPWLYL